MFRGAKYSVLQGFSVINIHSHRFHLTSKTFVRGAVRKNRCEDTREKHIECVSETLASQQSNVNFLGIESEEGVITINSKSNFEQQSFIKEKLREKFCRAPFGVIRYDSDNKLKFHGQYENRNDFSFPHISDNYSEVSTNTTKATSEISDATYDNFKLNSCVKNSDIFVNESHSNSNAKNDECSGAYSMKDDQDASYIDQYYFSNFSYTGDPAKKVDDPRSTDELNFLDKNYFENFAVSKNHESSNSQDFANNIFSVETSTNNSSKEDLTLNNFDGKQESDFIEGRKLSSLKNNNIETFLNRSDDVLQDPLYNQVDANYISDRKHVNLINSDNCVKNELFDEKIKYVNTQMNTNTADIKNNVLTKEKHFELEDNAEIFTESNVQLKKHVNIDYDKSVNVTGVTTAYDFVTNLRKQQEIPEQTIKTGNKILDTKLDSKGFRILKNQVDDLLYYTRDEIINLLKQNILYSDDNLLVLNKPYSLVIHDSQTTKSPCLSTFLDELAKQMSQQTKLFTVHRLDKETTGCLLLARNENMSQKLKSLFAQRKIIKKYWILTSGVPDPPEGIIDIPIVEGSVDNKKRMVLNPDLPKHVDYRSNCRRGKEAVTCYKILAESGNAALVEATPITGIKHQLRVHFGFGLSCPILGDHKYSHLDKLAPQKLPSDILQRLHVRQSKVRYIPLHIHAKSITIPDYSSGDLHIKAPLPKHMKDNLKRLKFKK